MKIATYNIWNDEATLELRTPQILQELDTVNNPRWAGKKSIYSPEVMERIYLMDHWYKTGLDYVQIFGTEVSKETGYAASDHYGVVAQIQFKK